MSYSNDFVVSILVDGQIADESVGGIVAVPFDKEYTIRLRNKHNRKAVAKVFIDEENVSEGGIVVKPYSFVDLECNVNNKNKFKFVSAKSAEAREAGKTDKSDSNGVIRVEWRLEREYKEPVYIPRPYPVPVPYPYPYPPSPWKPYTPYYNYDSYAISKGMGAGGAQSCSVEREEKSSGGILNYVTPPSNIRGLAEGCTVEGNRSSQDFTTVYVDLEPETTVIILTLRGYKDTSFKVGKKLHCEECGATPTSKRAKFCWNCGHRLKRSV